MKPNFPMGGGNMKNIMKQAQKMQQDMLKAQEELKEKTYTAVSGGGAVSVTINGNRVITELSIKPEVVDPDDVEMLQDLVMVAVNDALKQLDAEASSTMGQFTGGLF